MKPLYVTSALGASLYWMVIVVWIVSEAILVVRHGTVAGDRRQDRLSGPALVGFLLLAVWLGSIIAGKVPGAAIREGRSAIFVAGLVLGLAGIGIRQYAISTLGRFFSMRVTTRPDQTVVDTGLYRFVRHPSYSGSLLTVLGFSCARRTGSRWHASCWHCRGSRIASEWRSRP